jgi:hypothetical protein
MTKGIKEILSDAVDGTIGYATEETNFDDIIRKVQAIVEFAYEIGWSEGWDDGYAAAPPEQEEVKTSSAEPQ